MAAWAEAAWLHGLLAAWAEAAWPYLNLHEMHVRRLPYLNLHLTHVRPLQVAFVCNLPNANLLFSHARKLPVGFCTQRPNGFRNERTCRPQPKPCATVDSGIVPADLLHFCESRKPTYIYVTCPCWCPVSAHIVSAPYKQLKIG